LFKLVIRWPITLAGVNQTIECFIVEVQKGGGDPGGGGEVGEDRGGQQGNFYLNNFLIKNF